MSHFHAGNLHAPTVQCIVCETPITSDKWFARIKRDGNTMRLCSERCADTFYAKRLPLLRHINILALLQSPHWPAPAARAVEPSLSRP
jgi:ribosomal protein L24E